MRRLGYWSLLILAVVLAVLATVGGIMRLLDGDYGYALSNGLFGLLIALLLFLGARKLGEDATPAGGGGDAAPEQGESENTDGEDDD